MKTDSILTLEKSWASIKEDYNSVAYMYISIPVICSQSFANAEYITDELSRNLYKEDILRQTSPQQDQYLTHLLAYTPQNEKRFSGIQEIYNHVRSAGGYYGNYRGVVLIDVTEWKGHYKEKYFDIFLSYLSDQRMNSIIPFFYMNCRNTDSESLILKAALSPYFRSIQIHFDTASLCEYMISSLSRNNIALTESASRYLEDFIQISSCSPLFHGVNSIRQICKEISQQSEIELAHSVLLDAPLLKEILSTSGFSDIFTEKEERIIGFR